MRNKSELLDAIIRELEIRKNEISSPFETIYFGGGTPSILNEIELSDIFEAIYKNYTIAKNPEITIEANPDDLNIEKIKKLKMFPINRLSIGVQSFHDDELKLMHRVHSSNEAIHSIKKCQDAGFQNISIDLIYGMPGSNTSKWQSNLDIFLQLNLPHLSSYALTVEKKTALEHLIKVGKIMPVNDQLAEVQFYALRETMILNGYDHYELSNFSRNDYQSRHNVSYWQSKPYMGIGPSAHSFDGVKRKWNISNNAKYISFILQNKTTFEQEILTLKNRYNEYLMIGLRTKWGVNTEKIKSDFGLEVYNYFVERIDKYLKSNKLYYINQHEIGVNSNALFVVDGIISDLFMV